MANFIADIHCHPDMKPFGKSYPLGFHHTPDVGRDNCVWRADPPTFIDEIGSVLGGLTKFRQSDLTTGSRGRVRLVVVSLYPVERGFATGRNGHRHGLPIDALVNLATGVGAACINAVQDTTDYYPALRQQYDFWRQLDGADVPVNRHERRRYHLCGTRRDLDHALQDPNATAVVLSIEGAHALGPGAVYRDQPFDAATLLARVAELKQWRHPPVFVTLMHHFYNELGGHAPSLAGVVALVTNQADFRGAPLNELGRQVIRRLLDAADGRILIDVKHMSRRSRDDYYALLDTEFAGEAPVPIIVSHGAVMGPEDTDDNIFLFEEINFADDELVRIGRSGGLFGVQLDQRRIASKKVIQRNKSILSLSHGPQRWAGLVWQQLRHLAEVLDRAGLPAWDTACFGTDFDGIVNPIRRFKTHEDLPELAKQVLEHVREYFDQPGGPPLQVPANRAITPEQVLDRFVSGNALALIERSLPA